MSRTRSCLLGLVSGAVVGGVIGYWAARQNPAARPTATAPRVAARVPASSAPSGPQVDRLAEVGQTVTSANTSTAVAAELVFSDDLRLQFDTGFLNALEKLHRAGFSDEILAGVVRGEYRRRLQELHDNARSRFRRGELDYRAFSRIDRIWGEGELEAVRACLGEERADRLEEQRLRQSLLACDVVLPDDQICRILVLRRERDQRKAELSGANAAGELDPWAWGEESLANEARYEKDMVQLLGETGFRKVQRNDPRDVYGAHGYDYFCWSVADLNLSAAERDALWEAQRRLEEQKQEIGQGLVTGDLNELSAAAEAAWREETERVLGAQRCPEYEKSRNERYRLLRYFAPAWNLSNAEVNDLYETIAGYAETHRALMDQVGQANIQNDRATAEAASLQLQTLQTETGRILRQRLGEERFQRLQKTHIIDLK